MFDFQDIYVAAGYAPLISLTISVGLGRLTFGRWIWKTWKKGS